MIGINNQLGYRVIARMIDYQKTQCPLAEP
jgi:hypothetical protein